MLLFCCWFILYYVFLPSNFQITFSLLPSNWFANRFYWTQQQQKGMCILTDFAYYSRTHINRKFPLCRFTLFSCYRACSEVMEGWEDGCLSLCTWGPGSVCVCVCVFSCAHSYSCVSVYGHPCVCLHLCGRRRLFILIVFSEGPMCRIHNNTINPPQQQQHGCNLYGNAGSMVAPSCTVDISDNGQHGCAAAS